MGVALSFIYQLIEPYMNQEQVQQPGVPAGNPSGQTPAPGQPVQPQVSGQQNPPAHQEEAATGLQMVAPARLANEVGYFINNRKDIDDFTGYIWHYQQEDPTLPGAVRTHDFHINVYRLADNREMVLLRWVNDVIEDIHSLFQLKPHTDYKLFDHAGTEVTDQFDIRKMQIDTYFGGVDPKSDPTKPQDAIDLAAAAAAGDEGSNAPSGQPAPAAAAAAETGAPEAPVTPPEAPAPPAPEQAAPAPAPEQPAGVPGIPAAPAPVDPPAPEVPAPVITVDPNTGKTVSTRVDDNGTRISHVVDANDPSIGVSPEYYTDSLQWLDPAAGAAWQAEQQAAPAPAPAPEQPAEQPAPAPADAPAEQAELATGGLEPGSV